MYKISLATFFHRRGYKITKKEFSRGSQTSLTIHITRSPFICTICLQRAVARLFPFIFMHLIYLVAHSVIKSINDSNLEYTNSLNLTNDINLRYVIDNMKCLRVSE